MSISAEQSWKTLPAVLSTTYVKHLRDHAFACLNQLHQDYLPNISIEEFFRDYLGHTSLYAKLLAYRFFTTDIFRHLLANVKEHVAMHFGAGELLLHPIFYLRFSYPGERYPVKYRNAFLGSQPHYDRAYGLYAFSLWTALADADAETGGLCFFTDQKVIDLFAPGEKNKYNMDLYTEAAAHLDPLIEAAYIQPSVEAGSMLLFDSNILHAGTKPKTKPRISMDFRMVWANEVEKKDAHIRKIVHNFNTSPTYCNAMNLFSLGDYIGASRHMKSAATELNNEYLMHFANVLAAMPADPKLQEPHLQMRWQEEYKWI